MVTGNETKVDGFSCQYSINHSQPSFVEIGCSHLLMLKNHLTLAFVPGCVSFEFSWFYHLILFRCDPLTPKESLSGGGPCTLLVFDSVLS